MLSVGLAMTPLGAIAGSALGSGIGTLIQGGSLKDALKMGAIGGLTAGLFKGVQGGFRGMKAGQGFGTGFRAGVSSGLPGGTAYNPMGPAEVVTSQGVPGPAASPTVSVDALSPQPSAAGDLGRLSGTSAPTGFTPLLVLLIQALWTFKARPPVLVLRLIRHFKEAMLLFLKDYRPLLRLLPAYRLLQWCFKILWEMLQVKQQRPLMLLQMP